MSDEESPLQVGQALQPLEVHPDKLLLEVGRPLGQVSKTFHQLKIVKTYPRTNKPQSMMHVLNLSHHG